MKKHTQIYMLALGYDLGDPTEYRACELTGSKGVDVHHIVNRENRIENLMLLTRDKHIEFGEVKSKMSWLLRQHRAFLDICGVKYDNKWFEKYINQYSIYEN